MPQHRARGTRKKACVIYLVLINIKQLRSCPKKYFLEGHLPSERVRCHNLASAANAYPPLLLQCGDQQLLIFLLYWSFSIEEISAEALLFSRARVTASCRSWWRYSPSVHWNAESVET